MSAVCNYGKWDQIAGALGIVCLEPAYEDKSRKSDLAIRGNPVRYHGNRGGDGGWFLRMMPKVTRVFARVWHIAVVLFSAIG